MRKLGNCSAILQGEPSALSWYLDFKAADIVNPINTLWTLLAARGNFAAASAIPRALLDAMRGKDAAEVKA